CARDNVRNVGSMIICWCCTCSAVVASSPRNRANSLQSSGAITSFAVVATNTTGGLDRIALQPAHEPYRHNGPSRAATVLPWPKRVFPVLYEGRYRKLAQRHCRPSQQEIKC